MMQTTGSHSHKIVENPMILNEEVEIKVDAIEEGGIEFDSWAENLADRLNHQSRLNMVSFANNLLGQMAGVAR